MNGVKLVNRDLAPPKSNEVRREAIDTAWRRSVEVQAARGSSYFFRSMCKPPERYATMYPEQSGAEIAEALRTFGRPGIREPVEDWVRSEIAAPDFLEWEEFMDSIRFGKRKSGGPNGIPPGLLGKLPTEALHCLYKMLETWWISKDIPEEDLNWLTFLLPKTAMPTCMDQWRPIALTNVEYRIFIRILLKKLQPFVESKLHNMHFGTVRGKRAVEGANLLSYQVLKARGAAWLLSFDIKRAFDSVSIPHLLDKLRKDNCEPWVIDLLQCIYSRGEGKAFCRNGLSDG